MPEHRHLKSDEQQTLRDWHRLFGLLLADFFTDTPFMVEIERDLSEQQQFLDVLIVRKQPGPVAIRLPDGLENLVAHNLITFKSHHEALDAWAMKELIGHYVAYRKLVSPKPTNLLPESEFKLIAVCARFPQGLSTQVSWQERQAGVYDCVWGTDTVRVVVARELPQERHNAPLHLFSASPELVGFASGSYQQRSERASRLLEYLCSRFQQEGLQMSFTFEDFERQYFREKLSRLTPEERRKLLESLPTEERLAGLSPEAIRRYLDKQAAKSPPPARKSRKKK